MSNRLTSLAPPLAGAAGCGLLAAHLTLPPGHPNTSLVQVLAAAFGTPGLLLGFTAALSAALGLPWLLARAVAGLGEAPISRVRACLVPLWCGLAIAALGILLEPWTFRCPLPMLGLAFGGVGALAALWRLGALRRPHRPWLDPRRAAAMVVLVLAPLVWTWPDVQGDEPHYLMVARSLVHDRDLDLAVDYGEAAYRDFHAAPLSPHYKPGVTPGSRYSMHGVGYALVLAPAWAMGRALGPAGAVPVARFLQVLLFAGFAALLYVGLRASLGHRAAAYGTLATVMLSPFVFAPLHLFPESAIMLAGLAGYLAASRDRPSWTAGLPLAALPWLGVKTIPLALVLAFGAPWVAGRPRLRSAAMVAAPLLLSLAVHAAFTWNLYGSLSPSALYLGADPDFGRQPGYGASLAPYLADWPGALRTFVGYWLDQKEGLWFVGPHWLLAAAGLPWLWRHRRRTTVVLALALLAYVGPYALSQQIGGQSPPARPLMGVAWILAWPLAVGLAATVRPGVAYLRGAALAAGAVLTAVFVVDPRLLPHDYPVTSSWLLRALSPHGAHWETWFPVWLNVRDGWNAPVALVWALAAVLLVVWLLRGGGDLPGRRVGPVRASWAGATLGLVVAGIVGVAASRLVVTDRHLPSDAVGGVRLWVVGSIPEQAWAERAGAWVTGGRTSEIVVTAAGRLEEARLAMRSIVAQPVWLELPGGSARVNVAEGWERIPWTATAEHDWRGGQAWLLAVTPARSESPAEATGGEDHRPLGALIRVEGSR